MAVGRELHGRVGPTRWCITKNDLDLFEQEVRLAWKNGDIPNGTGSFHNPLHDDPNVGPTMYQVTEFFIKPITAQYGGMSFALLLHPEGLDCDCFATHAWAEGVFEFCDKLRRGWPKLCYSMYVCFLANPQNLDISELLDVPIEDSPFAKALSMASHMIVVPNRFVSIYTRLWCCFEAYFAYKLNKTILLPPAKILVRWLIRRYVLCLFTTLFTFIISLVILDIFVFPRLLKTLKGYDNSRERLESGLNASEVFFKEAQAQVMMDIAKIRRLCDCCLAVLIVTDLPLMVVLFRAVRRPSLPSKYVTSLDFATSMSSGIHWALTLGFYRKDFAVAEVRIIEDQFTTARYRDPFYLIFLYSTSAGMTLCAGLIVHILRVRTHEARCDEAHQLTFNCLSDAGCSDRIDRERIIRALKHEKVEVECALTTLMECGMSTPELRSSKRIQSSAGYVDYGLIAFNMLIWPMYLLHLWWFGTAMRIRNSYFHRSHILCAFTWTVLYYVICWVWFNAEADLSNVVLRAGRIAWLTAIVCGLGLGMWGIAAGAVVGVCFVADHRTRIQHAQFQTFVQSLSPVITLCCACLWWEIFATLAFGASCACLSLDIVGVIVGWVLCFVALRVAGHYWDQERILALLGIMFVTWASGNCLLLASNMLLLRKFKFFPVSIEHGLVEHIDLETHYMSSATMVLASGILLPLWLSIQEWRRAARSRRTRETAEVTLELPVIERRGRRKEDPLYGW